MKKSILTLGLATCIAACGGSSTSFSTLPTSQSFQQASEKANTKVDVLWVIDNSGSMASSQNNLATNFPFFINTFDSKGYDFRMAVTTSDAYLALPAWTPYFNQIPTPAYFENQPQAQKAMFRDGVDSNRTGIFVMDPATPNLNNVFVINAKQGTNGHGDERPFQSFKAALDSSLNSGFVRSGSFLAVIILTDEDDFSTDTTSYMEGQYNSPALHSVDSYVSYLDNLTGSSVGGRRFSVSSISVTDKACLDQINNGAQKIAKRVHALTDATNGKKASICGNFANELTDMANNIVKLATRFYLKAKPIESTLKVIVNGVEIPRASTNLLGNGGWTYIPTSNAIEFSGDSYVPPQGATINVSFDPDGLTF